MDDFLGIVGALVLLWCVIGMFIPGKVAPFLKVHRRKWILLITFAIMLGIGLSLPESDKSNSATNAPQTTQSSVDTEKQKDTANADAMNILSYVPQKYDQVEKRTIYAPWGEGKIPPATNLYWYAIEKDKAVTMRASLVHFTDDINWVFWDKLIFSTDQGKWEYNIDSFAGQSGGGKHTEVVMGGKYEMLDVPFDKLKPGIKLLVEGTNPIIRMQGKPHKEDFVVPAATIEQMKAGLQLENDLSLLGGKLK